MGEQLSPDQMRQHYVAAMGTELGLLQYELVSELSRLHFKWRQYVDLYGVSIDRVSILNHTAPLFFARLQTILLEDVLLHLTRLTDRPHMRDRENVTIKQLPPLILDANMRSTVESLITVVDRICADVRTWRNRRVAHIDLLTHREVERLPDVSRHIVELALEALRNLLNHVELHYVHSTIGYEWGIEVGGVDSLVHHLELSLASAGSLRDTVGRRR